MSTSNALQLALELAQKRRDDAARVLAQTRHKLAAATGQLEQLENYARECTDRWAGRSACCTPDALRQHYGFMERLTHAIGLQSGTIAAHERSVSRDLESLRTAESRVESLRQLVQKRDRELVRVASRREQKQSDEQATLAYLRFAASRFSPGF